MSDISMWTFLIFVFILILYILVKLFFNELSTNFQAFIVKKKKLKTEFSVLNTRQNLLL